MVGRHPPPRLDLDVALEQAEPFMGMEADQVEIEHRLHQPPMMRQGHQQLTRRPGRVQEEADAVLHPQTAQVPRHRDHVIVVDPDDVVGLDQRLQHLGEAAVGALIALAVGPLVGRQIDPVVEQGPQGLVGVAVVIFVDVLRLQIDGGDGDARPVLDVQFAGELLDRFTGPAEPQTVVFAQRRRQSHGQTACRARRRVLRRRDAVRDDNQPAHRASVQERLSSTAQLMIPTRE
ncbi:hypothetical protein D3C85_836130 [compost metagenome]